MKYNRELLKPIFEQTTPNLLLNKLTYNYGSYTITAWDQFCSKYSYELTLYSDRDTENITRFIQILIDNKHKIDLILQKQNLVRDLLLKDSYFTNLTTQRGGVDTTTNNSNSTSNSTQNNTTDTKTVSANSTQNADNKNLVVDKDTQMSIIDELSKNINYDLFNSTNIQNNTDNNTSTMTFGSNSTTITKNTADAIVKILSVDIKPLLDDFWNSFKPLFNYKVIFTEKDIVEPNLDYLNTVLRPFIEQQLNNYNLSSLDNRVEEYLDNKINLTVEQKDNLINQKINNILNQKDNKINELINTTIQTKRGFITTQIENLTNDIKIKLERELIDNVEQLKPELEVKIKELIQNENIPNKIEENINLLSPLINEKVEQAIDALSGTIKNKVSVRFEELLPIVDLKFRKELEVGELKKMLTEMQNEKTKLLEEINKIKGIQNNITQNVNELEQQIKDKLNESVDEYFKQKEEELKNKTINTSQTFNLDDFLKQFNESVEGTLENVYPYTHKIAFKAPYNEMFYVWDRSGRNLSYITVDEDRVNEDEKTPLHKFLNYMISPLFNEDMLEAILVRALDSNSNRVRNALSWKLWEFVKDRVLTLDNNNLFVVRGNYKV